MNGTEATAKRLIELIDTYAVDEEGRLNTDYALALALGCLNNDDCEEMVGV